MSDALAWLDDRERSLALQEWEWARTQAAIAEARADVAANGITFPDADAVVEWLEADDE